MNRRFRFQVVFVVLAAMLGGIAGSFSAAEEAASLRLIPFPKQVALKDGEFALRRPLVLLHSPSLSQAGTEAILEEFKRAGLEPPRPRPSAEQGKHHFQLAGPATLNAPAPDTGLAIPPGAKEGHYILDIGPDAIRAAANDEAGLFYAAQTLVQLLRANRRSDALPCLRIVDEPSLRWRCFQDDMTRGPSSKLETLQFEAGLGAYLKMNLMTYYMEHQFAFKKHPKIGPQDGSLTPEDLAALVAFAKPRSMDILGNQQSFGHFAHILKHPEYAALRETADILCPVKEESYKLLDDMYSEVCPILPFPFFNVCCDETFGLGEGPSKELAAKIGVGGVYVRHIRRIHDLLAQKYKKRMMMWGDIILMHPQHLEEIPKDTIMLTWAYDPRANFESQIIPFAKSGYEFFVCPGVGNWSRILPDFDHAMTNIANFVRDGVKHGAIGMLNTDWEDDGEALNAVKWHADAWAAECAWNASKTRREDFQRRVGAVLFGEKGDHFGQAVELLAKTHRMAGMEGMNNRRFWQNDFSPRRDPKAIRASAERLLAVVRPAIEHLEACRREAVVNQHILDVFLFGARRMEFIGQRMLDGLEAARLYTQAYDGPVSEASTKIEKAEALVRANREALSRFQGEFAALWLKESKPYGLDWTTKRYAATIAWYDDLLKKLADARQRLEQRKPLPRPEDLDLAMPPAFPRYLRPRESVAAPLEPQAPWADPTASHRLGLVVRAGSVDRFELPVELAVALPAGLAEKPVRAFCLLPGKEPEEIPAQLDLASPAAGTDGEAGPAKPRLVLLIPGPISKGSHATIHVYLGLNSPPKPLAGAASTRDAPKGMKWLENDRVRLLLGPEGAHVYRWEVKSMANRDLTEPGETGWAGFSDAGLDHRNVQHTLTCTARGPALVRYQCTAPTGQVKTISLFAGCSWMEVVLSEPISYYWDFDDPKNFAAEFATPGQYLFSTGATGTVGRHADGVKAQVKAAGAQWAIKFNQQKLAVGMALPETPAVMGVAPGSGAGGVGIEGSIPASHFVTFAGILSSDAKETMTRLQQTLDFRNPPEVVLYALQPARK
jgi:hexosaminidase